MGETTAPLSAWVPGGHKPGQALFKFIWRVGRDPKQTLHVYRGNVLALIVRKLGGVAEPELRTAA